MMSNQNAIVEHHCTVCRYKTEEYECPYKKYDEICLKLRDAAAQIGKAPQTLYNWKCSGKIPVIKLGGSLLFRKCQIMCYLALCSK